VRQIPREAMDGVKSALLNALAAHTNLNGLRVAPPKVTEEEIEHAACLALMALTKDWVRPETTKFAINNGRDWI
jgi:hypothetical protein